MIDLKPFRRKYLDLPVLIAQTTGEVICPCRLRDVSVADATIVLAHPAEIPANVMIVLTRNASVRRYGRVLRRDGQHLTVEFCPGPGKSKIKYCYLNA